MEQGRAVFLPVFLYHDRIRGAARWFSSPVAVFLPHDQGSKPLAAVRRGWARWNDLAIAGASAIQGLQPDTIGAGGRGARWVPLTGERQDQSLAAVVDRYLASTVLTSERPVS